MVHPASRMQFLLGASAGQLYRRAESAPDSRGVMVIDEVGPLSKTARQRACHQGLKIPGWTIQASCGRIQAPVRASERRLHSLPGVFNTRSLLRRLLIKNHQPAMSFIDLKEGVSLAAPLVSAMRRRYSKGIESKGPGV